jgi:rRNA-processing protein FCF1
LVNAGLSEFRGRDLLIDTNLLLLAVVGNFDHRLVGRERLDAFTIQDLQQLNSIIEQAKQLITTPGILTETSNLAAQMINKTRIPELFYRLRVYIQALNERYETSALISGQPIFLRFGLTDAAIIHIAKNGLLVLTGDRALAGYLAKNGIDVVNFNHLRALQ